jgi:hypothetical protein
MSSLQTILMPSSQLDSPVEVAVRPQVDRLSVKLISLFVLITLGFISARMGGPARAFFLVGAGSLGFFLSRRNPAIYVSFAMWLWFLTPFVRRVVNYRSGWVETDPILAASLLASLACFPEVCRHLFKGRLEGALPFLLAISAVAYGSAIGFFFIPLSTLLVQTANWATPIIFGLFVFFEYKNEARRAGIANAFESTFKWGLLVMGGYSLVQFIVVPGWDALWLDQLDNPAFGTAERFGVRVFSTMASPVPLGVAAFAGLVLLMHQRGLIPLFASVGGYISLALCSVRSTWGLWAIATGIILFSQRRKLGRFIPIIAVAITLLALSALYEPVNDLLQARVQTFSDLNSDGSYQARKSGYEQMYSYVGSNPLGSGLGAMELLAITANSELGGRDSGILEILLCLGWFGGAVYFLALALVVRSSLKGLGRRSPFEMATAAIGATLVSHLLLSTITIGFEAAALWSFAAMSTLSHNQNSSDTNLIEHLWADQ